MTFRRSSHIVSTRAQTILLASALGLWSMPALAQTRPERLSDKEVKTLIDQVDEGRDKFEGNLDGKFKGSTLRGTFVGAHPIPTMANWQTVQTSLGKLQQAFGLTP